MNTSTTNTHEPAGLTERAGSDERHDPIEPTRDGSRRRRFAAVAVPTLVFGAALLGPTLLDRGDDTIDGASATASEIIAGGSESVDSQLDPITGLRPTEELIAFWSERIERQPGDYISRTELGNVLLTAARENADLDLYAESGAAFTAALDDNADWAPARLGLASVQLAEHRFVDALAGIQAVRQSDDSLGAVALEIDARLGVGDIDGAAALAEQLVVAERSAPTVSRLARVRSQQGRNLDAAEAARLAVELSEGSAVRPASRAFYLFQLGHFRFANGETDAAIAAYQDALRLADHPGATEALPFALASVGRLDEAADRYAELVAAGAPADVHGLYADVLRALDRADEAATHEFIAEGLAVEDVPAERRHLAGFLTPRDPERAVQLAELDLAQRQDAGAHDTIAWALHAAGRSAEAQPHIEAALANGLRDARVLYHAAAIAHANGDDVTARMQLAEALSINPQFHPVEGPAAQALASELGL